ncbi:cobaltochelatase CobS [Catalinimonas alkaloidigena]|uniref:Cobaltochelatase CobS n=1 Tax=Catalinimonas alkaloidigena TaxID=1075417 RepID=A0A1G9V6G6_9BACT|nr:AAA family ATPase [Catalinimonas alkaloidigena]SDM67749.1 cobaltochelatase CobS [Catalinimonas alkaloidigena]
MDTNPTSQQINEQAGKLAEELMRFLKITNPAGQGDPKAAKVDVAQVKKIIAEELQGLQITADHLSPELLKMVSAVQRIELVLPSGDVVPVPGAGEIPAFFKIIDDLLVGNNVYLYGEAGTGKTTLAKEIGRALQRQVVVVSCNQFTSTIDLKGGQTIEGYQEGLLIEAWRDGKILVLDEMPKLDPNTAGILNEALAMSADQEKPDYVPSIRNGRGVEIKKHPDFCVIATGNTTGKATSPRYVGNNKLDLSLIDRFTGSYYRVEFNRDLEKSLLFSAVYEICDKIRDGLISSGVKDEIMTLRFMLSCNRIYQIEMERALGQRPAVKNGKTLKDHIDSYFEVMPSDKALSIKHTIDYDDFLNTYRGPKEMQRFRQEYGAKSTPITND